MTKAQERAAEIAARKRDAWNRKVRTLLGHVPFAERSKEATAAYEAGTSGDTFAALIASREPVGQAVHEQKVASVDRAEKEAREFVAKIMAKLEEHGWDVCAAAPYPSTKEMSSWSPEYKAARDRHNMFLRLTTSDPAAGYQQYGRAPYKVVPHQDSIDRFVDQAREMAAAQYDAFICKLVAKVGPATAAKLEGSHVWGYSHLTVTKPDGSTQVWKTQQIVNWSVLGNPYNQWPTRLLKGGAK